ncbi:MAG TPA: HAMP domain-containing protein [Dehalococcoidia bacterium]|jgi:signal transduction histidine kinase|nr:HAMP domain-containing protein [Dehalococcoidia bacterium]
MKLQYKITFFIFLILLVIGVAGAGIMLHLQRQAAFSQFEESALSMAEMIHETLEHDMLEGGQENIQDAVARIASVPLINEVVILSSTQKVYASGEISEIGKTRHDAEIAQALATGKIVTRTEIMYGQSELCVIMPVMNKPECQTCHGAEAKMLGAIEIGLNRSPIEKQLRTQMLLMALIGGLTFIAVGGAVAFMVRSAVLNPLSKLSASARRISKGDFSARAEVEKEDEVGMVARTFNEMAERVEQYARALEDSKRELEARVQERTKQVQQMAAVRGQLLQRLISAQEEERRRVARELHDEAGQALSAIMMNLSRAIEALPDEATEAKEKLAQSRSLAARTLADLRKLIYDLRPEVLDQLGLVPALRSYVKSHLEAQKIKAQLSFIGLKDRLSPQVEITLFRIIQEAITNIIRHSGASEVNIQVTAKNSMVTTTIKDNGKGFDVEAAFQAPESWGLRGIRERVAILGGELKIESKRGKGTSIEFRIPLGSV